MLKQMKRDPDTTEKLCTKYARKVAEGATVSEELAPLSNQAIRRRRESVHPIRLCKAMEVLLKNDQPSDVCCLDIRVLCNLSIDD